jgi:magnesium transporter
MNMSAIGSFVLEVDLSNRSTQYLDIETFTIDADNLNKIYWVHCDLSHADQLNKFKSKLQLTKDAINLCHKGHHITKILESEDFLTLQIQYLLSVGLRAERSGNLLIHLTARYCFTATNSAFPVITALLESIANYVHYAQTPCFVLFIVLESLVSMNLDILYDLEIQSEQMDLNARGMTYKEVANVKNHVMNVKRHSIALMNILMHISAREIQVVSEPCRTSLINILNNSRMVVNEADSVRELLNGTLGRIDNALMQQVNDAMKVLTGVATIFMPPTLIAGIYGMNFSIPELKWHYGYLYSIMLMLFSGTVMFYYFKKKKWI